LPYAILATTANISERQVQRKIDKLLVEGVITRERHEEMTWEAENSDDGGSF
jgi:predicted nuclease of restriction endonuclease-like (RecB) superfamily